MLKKIIIIILLTVANVCSLYYLKEITNNSICYDYTINDKKYFVLKKEIVLDNIDDFNINEYFIVLSFKNDYIKYFFTKEYLCLLMNNELYKYEYKIIK